MLETGTKAPDFTLLDQDGVEHSLAQYRGRKVILYFYPKDSTPGCTKQACAYSERQPQFREAGAVVLGISKDSVASHPSSRTSTASPSPCSPTRNARSSKPTTCGRKRRCAARWAWAWCAPPIL